ncbi:MAG: PDZ domain-containing protein, partial [Acidobacteria bacterium]|nr:PDZ domain-containing protein [Acidobacteriota bacterium]
VGFAVPSNLTRHVMEELAAHGKVERAWLGVMLQPVTPAIAKAFGLEGTGGALVSGVTPASPAAKAGLKPGDVILKLNGQRVEESNQLKIQVGLLKPGQTASLTILRDGRQQDLAVTFGEPQAVATRAGGQPSQQEGALEGVAVDNLNPRLLRELGLPLSTQGVVIIEIDPDSAAADAGLRRGDVIEQVNRNNVADASQFQKLVSQAGNQPILLMVNRGGETFFVAVEARS